VGITYKPLFKMLIDKGMNKTDLMRAIKISPQTLAKLSKNLPIDGKVLERICAFFQCQPSDVLEYIPNTTPQEQEV
jgi:DNA-binding Xre family transcriptional regulator